MLAFLTERPAGLEVFQLPDIADHIRHQLVAQLQSNPEVANIIDSLPPEDASPDEVERWYKDITANHDMEQAIDLSPVADPGSKLDAREDAKRLGVKFIDPEQN